MSQKKKTTKADAVTDNGFCVYLGPSIIGVIQNGTVFNGSKEEVLSSLKSATEKYPMIASLIVTDKTLSEDRVKVKTPGNLLYVNYHKLASGKR